MPSDSSYVTRALHATSRLIVNQNGDTPISENLDVSVSNARTSAKAYNTMEAYTSYIELETKWNSQGYLNFESNMPGAHYLSLAVKDELHIHCGTNLVHMYKDTTIDGNLDVVQSQAHTSMKAYFNHVGSSGFMMMEGRYRDQGFLHFETNYKYGEMFLIVNSYFIRCSDSAGNPYVQTFQPFTQPSDDRLKENEELIENACETLFKLRSQLYDKKLETDNDDPTTWYKRKLFNSTRNILRRTRIKAFDPQRQT